MYSHQTGKCCKILYLVRDIPVRSRHEVKTVSFTNLHGFVVNIADGTLFLITSVMHSGIGGLKEIWIDDKHQYCNLEILHFHMFVYQ